MKTKRFLSLFLALVMAAGFIVIPAASADAPEEFSLPVTAAHFSPSLNNGDWGGWRANELTGGDWWVANQVSDMSHSIMRRAIQLKLEFEKPTVGNMHLYLRVSGRNFRNTTNVVGAGETSATINLRGLNGWNEALNLPGFGRILIPEIMPMAAKQVTIEDPP